MAKNSTINFELSREIYGHTPWFMDSGSYQSLSSLLSALNSGLEMEVPEIKYNTPYIFDIQNNTKLISRSWQLDNASIKEAIGIININGPITKGGGASSYGTLGMSKEMKTMALDDRIKGFIVVGDSGGGSGNAVQIMVDTINEVKQTKPVYGLIEKGGMSCSAMYGIHSACQEIYAEDEMSIVGSIGTMMQFSGKSANTVDKNGTKNIRLYATKSTQKNKGFEEALNNDNYDILVNEFLDPLNERFISMIIGNRPVLKDTEFDNGQHVFAKEAVGTLIDGFMSFEQLVSKITNENKSNLNINNNSKKMTTEEIKNQFPEAYNSIVSIGASQEADRTGAWMAHFETDPETVRNGIKSGKNITQTESQELLVKASMKGRLEGIQDNSAPEIAPKQSGSQEDPDAEMKQFYNLK